MVFFETEDGFCLSAADQDENFVVVSLKTEKTPAQNIDRARTTLERQLTRLGATEFFCNELEIALSQEYFLPVSTLNALRRDLVVELLAERECNYPRWRVEITPNEVPYPEKELTFLGNVLNRKAEAFYRRHGVEAIEPAAKSGLDMQNQKVMTTKHCLKYEFGGCPHLEQPTPLDEPLYLIDEDDMRLRLKFNCWDCLMDVYFERAGR